MNWETFFRADIEPLVPYEPGLRPEQVEDIAGTSQIHKLSSNESPYPPFDSAIAAMQAELEGLNEYCDGASTAIRQALSEHYDVPFEQVFLGNGSNELVDLIAQSCVDPHDEVVYGWPSFVVYSSMTQLGGGISRQVPLRDDGSYDLDAMLDAIGERTKIVMVCNPNNPTGAVVSAADFERFLEQVPDHVLVVVDEAYIEFVEEGASFDALDYFDGIRPLVILRTFSKIYAMAGIRCGYGFAPVEVVAAIDKVREPFNVNSIAQAGAVAALADTDELDRRRRANREQRERLCTGLDALGITYAPSQTNFVWAHIPDADAAFQQLLERGVVVRSFGAADALRITVGTADDVTATLAALEEVVS